MEMWSVVPVYASGENFSVGEKLSHHHPLIEEFLAGIGAH
jgi:hypothetical protein